MASPAPFVIFGDGPVAHTLALGLRMLDFAVHLVQRPSRDDQTLADDPRAWALRPASLAFLTQLGVRDIPAAPLTALNVWHADQNGAPLAGRLHFPAPKAQTLGAVVPNAPLRAALADALAETGIPVSDQALQDPCALSQRIGGGLALLCEAAWVRRVPQRPLETHWPYEQVAATAQVNLAEDHAGVAKQVFLPSGPLALLPAPDPRQASLVWSVNKDRWRAAEHLPDLPQRIQTFAQTQLDLDPAALRAFPLSSAHASAYGRPGFVLVGDAAHRIHPLAGQGLNLALADVGALIDTLTQARAVGSNLGDKTAGSEFVLADYTRRRRPHNEAMRAATDQLNRFFGNDWGPLRLLRTLGMDLFNASYLKTALIRSMSDPQPLCKALIADMRARSPSGA